MIGDDHVDDSVAEAVPQLLLVVMAADRRSALQQGCAVGDILCGKVQIVRTGLDRDRQAFCARGLQFLQSQRGGEMDDMQTKAVLAAEPNHQPDGVELCLIRA